METDSIPEDFPTAISAVVPGAQPKLCVLRRVGLYVADQDDDARRQRWLMCEDLTSQLVSVAVKDTRGRPAPHEETLHRIRLSVARKCWVSPAELDWVIKRLRQLLAW
ncbi:hypothetical protein PPMP20_18025 [Paraburkholderia phymatum]|uniref:Uncharacterized protein n=1 Tax=Paraburkholderia phymatum (strain DSM 17167 / CIP 108236 / LMG 21445 / STM815) TaxID=391038 RepID=B2JTR3_PARP8|nr:hypothetical protein [Paraburkholderia phymatum]ACC75966.1 conserved hypothetical protein [Paraburkholderia phymatum STM815]